MRRKGFTAADAQRWRCDACRLSTTADRVDLKRMVQFRSFLAWITGKMSVREAAAGLGVDASTFSRKVSWCWNVRPRIGPDGVVHRYVEVDGTYLPYGWCLLVATGQDGRPIAWQWCGRESKAAYRALFARIERPGALVTDGGADATGAAGEHWKHARIQRCLVHVLRNTRTDLTGHPKSEAGRELLKLARGRQWWWTHERLRRAYHRFVRLQRDRTLFTFLEPELTGNGPVAGTTNQLEGGVNAAIKRVMRDHRGLSEPHMRRACEWAVYLLAANLDSESFVTPDCWNPPTPQEHHNSEPAPGTQTSIQLPAPNVDAYESGFGIHKGRQDAHDTPAIDPRFAY